MAFPISPAAEAFLSVYDGDLDQSFEEGVAGLTLVIPELSKYFKLSTDQKDVVRKTFLLSAAAYYSAYGGAVGGLTIGPVSSTPEVNALDLTGTVLTAHEATATSPGVMTAANYTKLVGLANITTIGAGLNLSFGTLTNSGLLTMNNSGTTPNAVGATFAGGVVQLQTGDGTYAGLMSPTNYTKLVGLANITNIGAGLNLSAGLLTNTSMLSSLIIDTFNVAGAQANALYFDGTNRLSVSAADFDHPGAISLGDQTMGRGVKTFQVAAANTTLLTPASNEVRIDSFKSESPLVPVLKLYSGSLPKAQFYALNSGVGYLEADTQTILKANANDALSVDGSGNTTILGGTSGVPQVTLGSSGSFWSWDGSGFGQMTISSESFVNYVSNSFSTLFGGHRWYFGASLAMTLSENNWLAPGSAAGLTLGTAALPWGQAWFQVSGTNATLGTASTNQITIRNDSASAQMWLKFNYAGTDIAGIRSDSFGSMVLDGSSDIFFMRSGTTKAQITSTALRPGTTNTLSLGTSSLKWADVQTVAASINGVGVFPLSTSNSARVDTTQTTTSTSYTDLATVGPTVTLTTGTAVLVTVCSFITSSTTSNSGYASFAVSGATTRAAADVDSCFLASGVANIGSTVSRTFVITGLNAGSNTFTMKYRKDGGAGTWTFGFRTITVQRLN